MAARRGFTIGIAVFGLVVAQDGARAKNLGPQDFAAPVYDAVAPGAPGEGLRDYRFIAGRDWPAIRLFAVKPLDWSRFGSLALPVENPEDAPFRLLLRIDDRADANGDDRSLTGTIDLPPHAHGIVTMALDAAPIGMVARPPTGGTTSPGYLPIRQVRGTVNLAHVMVLHVSGTRGEAERQLRIGDPMLRPGGPARSGPIADAFGQAIEGNWPEKVASLADLRAKLRQAEAATTKLVQSVVMPVDRYGGVDPDTRLAATGFFRVERTDRRWSLVTPAGHRFFSLGVDGVTSSNPTIVEGRRDLFVEPPPGKSVDVGQDDLALGLGPAWRASWPKQVLRRLKAWGFNSLGNWSSAEVTGAMPFVEFDDVEGDSAHVAMPGGRSLPDPFDPRFAGVADAVAARMTRTLRDDPMLLGYFSGNELPWGSDQRLEEGIAAQVMALGAVSPAKRAMVEGLERRYGSAAGFAAAWGLSPPAGWDDVLSQGISWPPSPSEEAKRDVRDFQRLFAARYFSTVASALKRHDPHHLYLGTRFADAPPEVVEACARWCDVLSFNVYGRGPDERAAAWRGFDRPVLIGEFHFGSTDRGSFWPGMVDVGLENARGPAYAAYLSAAVEDPCIVGAHWYQYADEPLTGRPYDGENGHIGLVTVTDVPYTGFVSDIATANRLAMERFAAQGRPDLRGTQ